jgi:hypothetical protein
MHPILKRTSISGGCIVRKVSLRDTPKEDCPHVCGGAADNVDLSKEYRFSLTHVKILKHDIMHFHELTSRMKCTE